MVMQHARQLFSFLRKLPFPQRTRTLPFPELFDHFQKLISENNRSLEIMADMGEKLSSEFVFDQNYIVSSVKAITQSVYQMIYHLDCMAPRKFHSLFPVYNRIRYEIESELSGRLVIPEGDYVIPFTAVSSIAVNGMT